MKISQAHSSRVFCKFQSVGGRITTKFDVAGAPNSLQRRYCRLWSTRAVPWGKYLTDHFGIEKGRLYLKQKPNHALILARHVHGLYQGC